jgi:hypothetical protein
VLDRLGVIRRARVARQDNAISSLLFSRCWGGNPGT